MTITERACHHGRRRRSQATATAAAALIATATGCADQPTPVDQPTVAPVAGSATPVPKTARGVDTPGPSHPHRRPAHISTAIAIRIPVVFLRLADCESGEWDRHKRPIPGSRRWDYNDGHYQGGFNFAPSTYTSYKPHGYPARADLASPGQQYVVARLVLRDQGVRAWPVCGPKVGLTLSDAA